MLFSLEMCLNNLNVSYITFFVISFYSLLSLFLWSNDQICYRVFYISVYIDYIMLYIAICISYIQLLSPITDFSGDIWGELHNV